ncbi:MAG TPA: hypothetical protein VHL11_18795 [Phototrophicaceae bacterium]|jgi:hypothetical protein|nr:hypothetical protein [Phototrophicaceae bacterium]
MFRRLLFPVICTILVLVLAPVAAQDEIHQWASDAEASSEYSDDQWSAAQATGEPDTDECGDLGTAWASESADDPEEYLTLYYDTPVFPTQVNIYETYNPGAITGISFLLADGGDEITVNTSADTTKTPCPGVFTINITWDNPIPVDGIVIYLNQTKSESWNEIDAVELVGTPADGDSSSSNGNDNGSSFSGNSGMSVNCDDGSHFDNGVEVRVIQMRAGFNYTATAIGLDGFDPVLAVLNSEGQGLCTDDDSNAAEYTASLPTTGDIDASRQNSQIFFANNSNSAFADISLVVGGLDNQTGEFLLVLEGMVVTDADGAGDAFALQITPGMVASGVTPSAYMISVTNGLDPLMATIDKDYNFITDKDDNYVACDDAGTDTCWGDSTDLTGYYISRTESRQLAGGQYDAMLSLPIDEGYEGKFFNFLMRSSEQKTFGDYIVVFHIGIGD